MKDQTLLLRQIHPNFLQNGRVSSQAFRPTPKDENRLSVYDGDQIDPEPAYRHYTERLCFQSSGVMAVTVSECGALALPVEADPMPSFPEHVVIDFSAYSKNAVEKKAKQLKAVAEARGWLYHG
jgi:hypothetical protein